MRHLVPELRETKQEPHVLPAPRWARPPVPGRQGKQPEEAQTPAGRGIPFCAPWYQHMSGLAAFWGGTGPVQRLSGGPQSSARRRSVTRPQAQLLKAGATCRAITQTQQRPFLPVAGLAEPGRAWESWLQTLPPWTRCQDSRPASVSEPSFPRSQSQVQTELSAAPLALVLFQFLLTPSPVSAGGGPEPHRPPKFRVEEGRQDKREAGRIGPHRSAPGRRSGLQTDFCREARLPREEPGSYTSVRHC